MLPPPALLQTLGFREEGQSGTLKALKEREGRVPASWVIPTRLGPRKDRGNIVFLQLQFVSFIHSFLPREEWEVGGESTAFGVRRKGRSLAASLCGLGLLPNLCFRFYKIEAIIAPTS